MRGPSVFHEWNRILTNRDGEITSRKDRISPSLAFWQTGVRNYISVQRSLVCWMGRMLTSWRSLYTLPRYLHKLQKLKSIHLCCHLKGFLNQKVKCCLCRKILVKLSEYCRYEKIVHIEFIFFTLHWKKVCFSFSFEVNRKHYSWCVHISMINS